MREAISGRPCGPPSRPIEKRNHVSSANGVCAGGVQTIPARISREAGPWTAMLWRSSVDSFTHTRSPSRSACSRSQTPSYSAPPTKRKLSGAMRNTVPSSSMPPVSLHIAV